MISFSCILTKKQNGNIEGFQQDHSLGSKRKTPHFLRGKLIIR